MRAPERQIAQDYAGKGPEENVASRSKRNHKPTRRSFLKGAAGGILGTALDAAKGSPLQETRPTLRERAAVDLLPVSILPESVTRTWLGPAFWANRLQDWRLHKGRLECLTGAAGDELRTVAVLTREILPGNTPAHLSVQTGPLEPGGTGFCGFLVGAGGGELDYRAAALVQKASGTGGGLLCTYESDGRVRFREHSDEEHPLAYAELPADEMEPSSASPVPPAAEVLLRLDILPQGQGRFELKLSAWAPGSNQLLAGATRRNVAEQELIGGILLVSSTYAKPGGGRYWFRDLRASGRKIALQRGRSLGPIVGALHSLNGKVLKISAQFMPIGENEPRAAKFQYRLVNQGDWQDGPTAELGPGYVAQFRLENWDSRRNWEYRVVYPSDARQPSSYSGVIRRDPVGRDSLTIALFSCTVATARSLEMGGPQPQLPAAEVLGRYTSKNFYFPHAELVRNASQQQPDLLAFVGDQIYEGNPTRRDSSASPVLDYLYKWYLWVWSFREITRSTPAILMVDDHDVYHGNLWGNGGRLAPERDQNRGGYRCTGDFVNVVQGTQCGHNPDPYDAAPVAQDIAVYYGAFRFGGVSFALIEDRKFKTAPIQGADLDVHEADLLGERQEKFLEAWAKDADGAAAKVCFSQTLFACVQTSPAGRPLLDFDSNGYPKLARDRAIELLREARSLVLSGDQHLATLVRHGLDSFTDGVVQFTGPAGGSSWQRWFEPARPLPNALGTPYTGDFSDAFGNKVRVLAVANPKVSFQEYRKHSKGRGQGLGDRKLKSEGYGIIRVHRKAQEFVIECWPWNVDPSAPGAQQFPGWPYRLPFDQLDGRQVKS